MDSGQFQTDVLPVLQDCGKLLDTAAQKLQSKNSIVLIESEGLYRPLISSFNRLIRRLPAGNGIDLILHSLGGTTDAASAIASLCRVRFGSFRVVIPFLAKSAGTLLALAANERLLSTSAQLGPVDPQVRHPEKQVWFPAHSIREALQQVEATKDNIVKASMADKLDPFLLGAYQDAIQASKQYIEMAVDHWPVPTAGAKTVDRAEMVSTFIEKYKSHGYPIDCKVLTDIGVPHKTLDPDVELLLGDLHEKCTDVLDGASSGPGEDGAIILTKDEYFFRFADFKHSGKLTAAPPVPAPAPPPAP